MALQLKPWFRTPTPHERFCSHPAPTGFLARLRSAGVEPGDGPELQLTKSLLMLATGLVTAATMIWVAIYHLLGLQFSSTLPFAFQLLLVGNMLLYVVTRNFELLSAPASWVCSCSCPSWRNGSSATSSLPAG